MAHEVHRHALIIMLAVVPVTVFQGLKEPVEMIWKRPRNLFTLGISMAFLVFWFYATKPFLSEITSILYGYLGAFWVRGILTVMWARSYLRPVAYFGLGRLVVISVGIGLPNLLLASVLSSASMWSKVVVAMVAGGLLVTAAFAALYLYRPSGFVSEAVQFMWPGLSRFRLGARQVDT